MTEQHYEDLLAEVYDWMQGGWELSAERYRSRLSALELRGPGAALDLGAGTGFQAVPLAEAGYTVTAVDISSSMLRQLEARAKDLKVRTIQAELESFESRVEGSQDLVVCMGDTLSSLGTRGAAARVLQQAARCLSPAGRLVLEFRDLSRLPEGDGRFLPIRSDDERIFTCFLEEVDADRVRVHDVLHIRASDGFEQRVSSYIKARLDVPWLHGALAAAGLETRSLTEERGLITCVAARAAEPAP